MIASDFHLEQQLSIFLAVCIAMTQEVQHTDRPAADYYASAHQVMKPVFDRGRRLFSGPVPSEMADAFEAYENQVMGPGQHEALHATLKRLLAKYPA